MYPCNNRRYVIILRMSNGISFADWLNEKLRERNLTQAGLARKAGLNKSVINKLSRSIVIKPDAATFVAIAKALDVSPITVLRIAEILPPDPELPELEDYKIILAQLSHEMRQIGLELIKTVARCEKQQKVAGSAR